MIVICNTPWRESLEPNSHSRVRFYLVISADMRIEYPRATRAIRLS